MDKIFLLQSMFSKKSKISKTPCCVLKKGKISKEHPVKSGMLEKFKSCVTKLHHAVSFIKCLWCFQWTQPPFFETS